MKKKLWTLLIASLLISSGCQSNKHNWDDIPLVQSGLPYKVPPGTYIDTEGQRHEETIEKWVISDADLYDFIQYLKHIKGGTASAKAVRGEPDNPYKISPGVYKDTEGGLHAEETSNWVILESDVESMPEFIEYLTWRKKDNK